MRLIAIILLCVAPVILSTSDDEQFTNEIPVNEIPEKVQHQLSNDDPVVIGTDDKLSLDEAYENSVQAYLDEDWDGCIEAFTKAIAGYKKYKKVIIECRRECREKAAGSEPVFPENIEDLHFYEKKVRETLCLLNCNQDYRDVAGPQSLKRMSNQVENNYMQRTPYEYLHLCYYQKNHFQKAADAMYTYLVIHPKHEMSLKNLRHYVSLPEVTESEVTNLEAEPFVKMYINGVTAYEEGLYSEVVNWLENSLQSYLKSEEDCRLYCEGHFDQGWHPEFTSSIANHFTYSLKCKRSCSHFLNNINGEYHKDLLPSHYHYLQFAYYKLGDVKKACAAVGSYLLFYPSDETMLENKDYYSKLPKVEEDYFTPRPEALNYVKRQEYELRLLLSISEEFATIGARLNAAKKQAAENEREDAAAQLADHPPPGHSPAFQLRLPTNKTIAQKEEEENKLDEENSLRPEEAADVGKEIRLVADENDLGGKSRYVAEGFLNNSECETLIRLAEIGAVEGDGYEGNVSPHSTYELFEGLTLGRAALMVYFGLLDPEILELALGSTEAARDHVERYFNLDRHLYFTYTHLACRSALPALLKVATTDLNTYRNKYIVSGEFNETEDGLLANGFYSGSAMFAIPATVNMLSNAIVKAAKHDDSYGISLSVEELPDKSAPSSRYPADIVLVTLALGVFLTPAVALYVTQPLQENVASVKQLELMTGASSFSYWISIYLFDLVQYIISIILLISIYVAVDAVFGTNYYRGTEIMIFFLLLLMFGMSVLPLVYIFSFWKRSMNASINILSIVPTVLCFIDCILLGIEQIDLNKTYVVFRAVQSRAFLLLPHVSLMYGHAAFFQVVKENSACRSRSYGPNDGREASCTSAYDSCCAMKCRNGFCENPDPYFVDVKIITSLRDSLLWMTGSVFLYFFIIFMLEQNLLFKLWARIHRSPLKGNTSNMDELVKKEENEVSSEVATWLLKVSDECNRNVERENIFLAHEISKRYGNLEVVKGISFRVKQGECFGLLGVNGAGKSTTFKMLTGAEIPYSGTMFLKEHSLQTDRTKYLAEMGYCPQQDAIIDTLNAYDHLYLFARLRGIPENEVKAAVHKWISKLNLKRCATQPSGTYSGGNKRRLNIAVALIGNPSLVLMDEPTTGVDPAARRSLWTTVKICQEGGQSIILTSHSMEECEALCNRLVIMVKGQLVCIGASQELKQRFGAGYNIHVKLYPACERADVEKIKRRIESTLVCKLSDENTGFIGYHVTDPEATWTIMYTMMRELKNNYPCIEDFAVLSSTLEQLFIQFARAPGDDSDAEHSRKKLRWWRKRTQSPSPV